MLHPRFVALACAVLVLAAPALASAQGGQGGVSVQREVGNRMIPGWVFTPSVGFGFVYDDNPLLAGEGIPNTPDTFTLVTPGVSLELTRRHTEFDVSYFGSIQHYRTLSRTTDFSQGARMSLQHQATRRLRLSAQEVFTLAPSTDFIDVVTGVPFVRNGTRQNNASAGLNYTATKSLEVSAMYNFQWIDFNRNDPLAGVLSGGQAHRVNVDARQRLTERIRVGGLWNFQHADLTTGTDTFDIQNGEGLVEFRLGERTSLEAGAGVSYLSVPTVIGARTGPSAHVQFHTRTEHAFFSLGAMRSFVPAFGFGGSLQNSELNASARVPFYRRRAYAHGTVSWRRSEPVLETGVGLRSVLVRTTLGYAVQRWLHVEAFYAGSFQETTARGRINRNRIGIQVVTSHPMRIR
jgi:hypothetical protein